jgi:hypothetical protein
VPSVTTALNLNSDVPAAPTGYANIIFQSDQVSPMASITAFDNILVGDSGSGGYSGNVPAPASGDAAAGKYLCADGTWSVPASGTFTSGNNSNGYWVQDPTGHIHQWGTVTTDINNSTLAVTFPTTFTTSGSISVVVSTKSSSDRITFVVDGTVAASGFTIANNGSGGFAYWQADGV